MARKFQTIELGMLAGSSGYPELSAKASGSRHLVKVMLLILRRPEMHNGSEHDDHRLLCYEYLAELYEIIEAHGLFLEKVDSDRLLVCTEKFLLHYNWLATEAMKKGCLTWSVVPKFHFLWHIAFFSRYNSPRAYWCYAFEDFVGKVQGFGMACVVGTPMHMVPAKIFQNYMMAFSLHMEQWK